MRKPRSRDHRYRRLVHELPDAVLVVSRGLIRYANRAAAALLGATSRGELRGLEYNELVLSTVDLPAGMGERQKLRCRDARIVDVDMLRTRRGAIEYLVLRETGILPSDQEHLRQAQRMEAVGRLASGIAHDFNNLLTAIHGHAQFLIEDLPDENPSRTDAEEILHSAERAAALTRQLLAFTRGQAMQLQVLDLNHVVASVERLLRRVITENITLTATLEPSLWSIRGDASQIEQILVNLVLNARDAMPNGGTISIKTSNAELADSYTARREEVSPGRYVMLAVSDTGIGMDATVQAHIFEPFFTTKHAGKGTGLGLSTVYGIVKQAGGHIFVYSERGQGTTFKIYLPAVREYAESRAPRNRAQSDGHGETILLVEDDTAVRSLARRVLEGRGYHVLPAATGAEAVELLNAHNEIALLVTDVVLPDTNGASVANLVREVLPACGVLLMSGYTSEDVRRQGAMPSGADFIEKPFTPDALADKVRSLLDAD